MGDGDSNGWRVNRQVSLTVVVQLLLLSSLILGSWVNLQRQLGLLEHDVSMLLENQEQFQVRLEEIEKRSISREYRLRFLEKRMAEDENERANM